ncbi:cytochrome P450 [Streptomyces sp. ACA25]|uniref:cytochrome P450 n=1 Tax=Streptomyces sp. ACA25 TaxID=3022596 RepID=UPI0023082FCF|nr:cytochrome P450 [Streptomyces sp. ACA25]MDB1086587.1 cytochrome P450 [Streptomyces sp. ACA25]
MTSAPSETGPVPPSGCPAHQPFPGAGLPADGPPALYGPEFAADPDAVYSALRERGPAHWVEIAPGVEAVLVTAYDACLEVLRNPQFSKDARRWTALAEGRVPSDNQVVPMLGYRPSLMFADGHEHLRLRASVDDTLARVNPHRLRGYVQRSAVALIDEFAAEGTADLVSQYCARLPARVFTQLFGCPDELAVRMATACGQMIDAEPAAAQQGSIDLARCLGELVAEKRRSPGADVTSWLLSHHAELDDTEMVHQLVVLIGAGTVPQSAWISTATMMLLTDDRFGSDLSGGSMTVTDALNEVLWSKSPMANFCCHFATQDFPLRDETDRTEFVIPAGVPVLVSLAAANTDPALAASHEQRAANLSHLAFSGGPHVCPAQDIAGIIADVAIETLLDRLPDMELDCEPGALTWRPGPFHRTLTALPVRFPAVPARATTSHADPTSGAPTWNTSPAPSSTPQEQIPTPKQPASGQKGRRRWWSFPAIFRRGR